MRLGPYEITAHIGAGGMGDVWRATDTNSGRHVAIRVLHDAFARDHPARLARFEREAKTLAALKHPNIAAIHGLERSVAVTALVMELIEGPTLADRIAQGPVPLGEALPMARQVGEALEAAHEVGIIHLDLKPSNIKLLPDNVVKVLDFGLAQIFEPDVVAHDSSRASTSVSRAARLMGVITGTPEYMSPEQVHGQPLDHQSDIWAFGCVLFEMLTGRPVFDGEDLSAIFAVVLEGDPEWTALPATTPTSIRQLLRRCLDKNPERRVQDISEALKAINEAIAEPAAMEEDFRQLYFRQSLLEGFSGVSDSREHDVRDLLEKLLPELKRWTQGRVPAAIRARLSADALVEEAVVAALRRLRGFHPRHPGAVRAYLRQVIINRIRDEIRRSRGREEQPYHSSPLSLPLEDADYRRYRDALERLKPHERELIRRRVEQQWTDFEIERGFKEGPLRRAVRRVVQWLMKLIGRDKDGDPPFGPMAHA